MDMGSLMVMDTGSEMVSAVVILGCVGVVAGVVAFIAHDALEKHSPLKVGVKCSEFNFQAEVG